MPTALGSFVPVEDWIRLKEIGGKVQEIINVTDRQRLQRSNPFNGFLPTRFLQSTEYEGLRADYQTPIANVVGLDQIAPPVKGGRLQNFQVDFVKMVSRRVFTEAEQEKLYRATNEYGLNLGITTYPGKSWDGRDLPPIKNADGNLEMGWIHPGHDIADFFFTTGIIHRRHAVFDMMDYLAAQSVQFGRATYVDPATNYRVELDWTDPDADYINFPAPLTQTGNTADPQNNDWSDLENAAGLQYLRNAHLKYIERNGFVADKIIMTRMTYYRLLDQRKTKEALQSYVSNTSQLSLISAEQFNRYIQNYDIPPIELVEDKFDFIAADGTIQRANFFNNNRVTFLKRNMGARCWGVVMKSKQGLQGRPRPGIYSDIVRPHSESAARVAYAEGKGIPVFHNLKTLQSQQVSVVEADLN
ncbi:MAG: hypothetical protein QNJ54_25550 [Prochloraceae cyanobacterium]|nr:hypothetical protein [Prochloraceae cyanobacterium]